MTITELLGRLPRAVSALIGVVLVVGVGALHGRLGPAVSVSLLYFLPVSFVTWYVGTWAGALAAVVCTGVTFWVHLAAHQAVTGVVAWNTGMSLGVFLFVVFIVAQVRELYEREKTASRHDYLTGSINERAFHEFLSAERNRARRYNYPLTLAYIDLDNFKDVNDRYGHAAGDEVLVAAAATIRQNIRQSDLVARVGGDEFVVMLPEAGVEAATSVLQKLRVVLAESMKQYRAGVTFSIGAVTFTAPPDSNEEMIRRADELMYQVKAEGKNSMRQTVVG